MSIPIDPDAMTDPDDPRYDAWYYHDERDHAWHTERRYDECRLCQSTPDEVDELGTPLAFAAHDERESDRRDDDADRSEHKPQVPRPFRHGGHPTSAPDETDEAQP